MTTAITLEATWQRQGENPRPRPLLGPPMRLKMRLAVVNLGLVVLIAAVSWQLYYKWVHYRIREATLYLSPVTIAPPGLDPLTSVQSPSASEDAIITESMLFASDRVSTIVSEPKIMPPFSGRLSGVGELGDGSFAIMCEQFGAKERVLRTGDRVGPFTLVSIDSEGVVLEWEGQQLRLVVRQGFGIRQ